MKKYFTFLLAVIMLLTSIPATTVLSSSTMSKPPSVDLIYDSDNTRIYHESLQNGNQVIYQYDNDILTMKTYITDGKRDSFEVEYFNSKSSIGLEKQTIKTDRIIKKTSEEFSGQYIAQASLAAINYSKLGNVFCMLTDGTYFDIGFYYATKRIGSQTTYTPVNGVTSLSFLITAVSLVIDAPAAIASSVVKNLMFKVGVYVVGEGIITIISPKPLVCTENEYYIRLNRFYDGVIRDTVGSCYYCSEGGVSVRFDDPIVPIKNSSVGYNAKAYMFPSGGATYLNWR